MNKIDKNLSVFPGFMHFQCLSIGAEGSAKVTLKTIRDHMLSFNMVDSSGIVLGTKITQSAAPKL